MPRRSIDRSAPKAGTVIDIKTGQAAEKPALPILCERIRFYREKAGLEQKALAGRKNQKKRLSVKTCFC